MFDQELSHIDHIVGMIEIHIMPGNNVWQHIIRIRGEEKAIQVVTRTFSEAGADNDRLRIHAADRTNCPFLCLKNCSALRSQN